jgi:hypothetical protein
VSAPGFDPHRPVDRPIRARVSDVVAIPADALLASDSVVDRLQGAGCAELLVDFDTLGGPADSRALALAGLVEQLRRRGLAVSGIFTLGHDHDDLACFERLVDWVEDRGLLSIELRLWTPDPGSAVVRALAREGRVRHRALDRWDGAHVVVAPKQMSAQTLYRGWVWAQRRLSSPRSIWRRRPREWGAWPSYFVGVIAAKLMPVRARTRQRLRPAFTGGEIL